MSDSSIRDRFSRLTTAHVADGCLRVGVDVRCAPAGIQSREPGKRIAGRALPAKHAGSVDVFLEALQSADPGDVFVIDNAGRLDESCVGDLIAQETASAGVTGILIWGLNRDSEDLRAIDIPVFSLGTIPTGPLSATSRAADALEAATIGEWTITRAHAVFGDDDGAVFVPMDRVDDVLDAAEQIRDTERKQADRIRSGESLRSQVRFEAFLAARAANPGLTFREHLRAVGGEIEV